VRIQRMHQRLSLLNNPNARVAMPVNPTLVALGQAEPPLQIEIVANRRKIGSASEQAGQKAQHHLGHLLVDRILLGLWK
jgi:hypothetical protein